MRSAGLAVGARVNYGGGSCDHRGLWPALHPRFSKAPDGNLLASNLSTCPPLWSGMGFPVSWLEVWAAANVCKSQGEILAWLRVSANNSDTVTPDFPKETKCIPICMPGSSFMHIVTYK
jgi:hypothetical protein